jgi:hypothetical protein
MLCYNLMCTKQLKVPQHDIPLYMYLVEFEAPGLNQIYM